MRDTEDMKRRRRRYGNKTRRRIAVLLLLFVLLLSLWPFLLIRSTADVELPADTPPTQPQPTPANEPEPEPEDEGDCIEAALVEQGYFRDDIPLSYELQDYLHSAADEAGIDYDLALSVVWKETTFQNLIGDGGESFGYMQVQPKWHAERMARLGVTDLMEPYGNFRVGCDYLAECLQQNDYDLYAALTQYNSGLPGRNEYSEAVVNYMNTFKEET